jgi:hypothetical protein
VTPYSKSIINLTTKFILTLAAGKQKSENTTLELRYTPISTCLTGHLTLVFGKVLFTVVSREISRREKESVRRREGRVRLVPAMQSLVEIDGVLPRNDLILADFRLLHHGC